MTNALGMHVLKSIKNLQNIKYLQEVALKQALWQQQQLQGTPKVQHLIILHKKLCLRTYANINICFKKYFDGHYFLCWHQQENFYTRGRCSSACEVSINVNISFKLRCKKKLTSCFSKQFITKLIDNCTRRSAPSLVCIFFVGQQPKAESTNG